MTEFMKEHSNSFDDINFFHTFSKISQYLRIITLSKIQRFSSIYNKDLSTPGQSRVCSNPCYIYYYDDETIPLQAFLCKFGF